MAEPKKIDFQVWFDVLRGNSKNPLGDEEITEMAKRGEIIVVQDGKDHKPVLFSDYGDGAESWKLEEIK
tara:strand:+ start:136700 stop:136906 length:207 start_codon:yes stop_codon:yes gene_type:complete